MQRTKEDSGQCIHCQIEVANVELVDYCKCPKCGKEDFEEVWTDEWAALSDCEREEYNQWEEDNDLYNSVRMGYV